MRSLITTILFLGSLTAFVSAEEQHYSTTLYAADTTINLFTSGNCGMCQARIEEAAQLTGVSEATWTASTQLLSVTFDPELIHKDDIKKSVAGAGHDIDGLRADDEVYKALHACCLYTRPEMEAATDSTTSFTVAGACSMCRDRILETVQAAGLHEAVWDVKTNLLTLNFDPTTYNTNDAKERLIAIGHDVDGQKATEEAYAKLPACCQYHDEKNPHKHDHDDHHDHDHIVVGVVMEEDSRGNLTPLQSANVYWIEDVSVRATSDASGVFRINHEDHYERLVVSYAGHDPDTLIVKDPHEVVVVTAKNNTLAEVTVTARRRSNYISALSPTRLETLTGQELFKAACCDLSESFETNASVDVVSSDAVTGSKQIQMLGLSGNYTQLTVENLPGPRGLAIPLGLNSIAGTWIESIQISKGIGSVVSGFENIAGQINVELKKPENSERLFFNAYVNNMGRTDVNLNLAHNFNEKWSTAILLHDNFMYNRHMNFSNNGFRDMPVGNLFSGINRWKYEDGRGFILQFGVKFLSDDRVGGTIDFNPSTDRLTKNHYGLGFDIERYEAFAKIGYVFPENIHRSLGLQMSGSVYNQASYFGMRTYDAEQTNGYSNLIYQDILGTVVHKYRTGVSVMYDKYNEIYRDHEEDRLSHDRFTRMEVVPGAFLEYTYSPNEKFDAVVGMRGDYNNLYGWFATPRLHLRYQPVVGSTIRLSAGRGQRTANIFAENTAALASSRIVRIASANSHTNAYGLRPEVAWNTGVSFDQDFRLLNRQASFSVELFRNDFTNQVVVDFENPRELSFYNLDGRSYSNSLQTEFRFMPFPHFEARTAYRFFDVKTTYGGELLQRPLVARHRGFLNLAYNTHSGGWHFDYTLNVVGQKRMPYTGSNPVEYQMVDYSKAYVTMNAQVSKTFGKVRPVDVYIGGENLTNFFQSNPILAADQPFSSYFDTSMLWGPVSGRMFYAGIRIGIN